MVRYAPEPRNTAPGCVLQYGSWVRFLVWLYDFLSGAEKTQYRAFSRVVCCASILISDKLEMFFSLNTARRFLWWECAGLL